MFIMSSNHSKQCVGSTFLDLWNDNMQRWVPKWTVRELDVKEMSVVR
jgi:hypothetical protein